MPTDEQHRAFQTVAIALGSDPDLAAARAMMLRRDDETLGASDAYLLVLRELCEGKV